MQSAPPSPSGPGAVDAGNAADVAAASTTDTAAHVTAVDATAVDVTAAGGADVATLARRQFMQRLALAGLDFPESSLGPLIAQVADLDRAAAMLRGDCSYRDEPSNIFQPAAFGGSAV